MLKYLEPLFTLLIIYIYITLITLLESPSVSPKKNVDKIDCYIHSVSPIKTGGDKKYRYFDFNLQTESKVVRAVCFSPDRKEKFDHYEKTKSPVKITKYSENNRYGTTNVVIERHTVVEPAPPHPFERHDINQTTTISSLTNVTSGQQVTIKGHLTELFGSRKIFSKSGETHIKQDGLVSDATGTIKVTFWGDFVDIAEKGQTYNYKQFVYKNDNFGIYITTSSNASTLEQTDSLTEPLAKPNIDEEILTTKELTVNLLGISSASHYLSCSKCRRKIEETEDDDLFVFCSPCNLTQKVGFCTKQWVVKFFLQSTDNPNHKFYATAFHNIVQELAAKCSIEHPIDVMSSQQLTKSLLGGLNELKIVYDTRQKKIIELA